MKLQLQPSTAVTGATYDPDTQALDVTFSSGQTYTFEGVPQDVADAFEAAPSPGSFYHSQLKGRY